MPAFPNFKTMAKINNDVPSFCDELDTITLDNKNGHSQKFIDAIDVSDGRTMNIMASADKKTCIRNDLGKINNVIGEVRSSGSNNNVNIGLLLL